ncbi:solute carrier family 15 member 4 [Strongylocentrotus purpuratus]|uniref:Uncharacterized protein n=1 Tax=Strongylocentrotus purpuratus TaxID=7668 RepID=A0A7M7NZI3_STRPU|nr:solute carrier family 15 member 4 [Strongylocentrotus purpuratus]
MLFFKYARSVFQQTSPDKGKATALVVTAAGNAITSKVTATLATVSSCCHCNCCPNLCSSLQKIDGESVELLSESALKSTSTTVDVADVDDPSTLSSTANPTGSASVDKSTSICPAPTAVTYGTLDLDTTMTAESTQGALPETARHALWVCYAIILLSCEFPYSIVRYQVTSSFVSQAERMKPTILGQAVSPSLLARYLPLLGIAFAPLVNTYIYPYVSKRFITMTTLNRIIIGIALATLSVLSAATVETARLTFIDRGDFFFQEINNQTVVASTLSLDFLIPQYFFMGVADVFIFISGLEFAFTQSPCNIQSIVTGIFLFYAATGRIVAILLVPLINTITAADPWYPYEINDGHLNYYFLVLTAISLTNLIIFFMMEKGYEVVDGYLCPDEDTIDGSTTAATTTATTPSVTISANANTVMPLPQPVSSITSSA